MKPYPPIWFLVFALLLWSVGLFAGINGNARHREIRGFIYNANGTRALTKQESKVWIEWYKKDDCGINSYPMYETLDVTGDRFTFNVPEEICETAMIQIHANSEDHGTSQYKELYLDDALQTVRLKLSE